jgi:hypothetical protein
MESVQFSPSLTSLFRILSYMILSFTLQPQKWRVDRRIAMTLSWLRQEGIERLSP